MFSDIFALQSSTKLAANALSKKKTKNPESIRLACKVDLFHLCDKLSPSSLYVCWSPRTSRNVYLIMLIDISADDQQVRFAATLPSLSVLVSTRLSCSSSANEFVGCDRWSITIFARPCCKFPVLNYLMHGLTYFVSQKLNRFRLEQIEISQNSFFLWITITYRYLHCLSSVHLIFYKQVIAASISWAVYSSVDVRCPIRRAKESSSWHIPVPGHVIYHVFYKCQMAVWAKYSVDTMKLAAFVRGRSAAQSHAWPPQKLSTKYHSTNGSVRAYLHGRFVIDCCRMASVPTIIYPV